MTAADLLLLHAYRAVQYNTTVDANTPVHASCPQASAWRPCCCWIELSLASTWYRDACSSCKAAHKDCRLQQQCGCCAAQERDLHICIRGNTLPCTPKPQGEHARGQQQLIQCTLNRPSWPHQLLLPSTYISHELVHLCTSTINLLLHSGQLSLAAHA
jgi:hypothetical protein